MSYNLDFLQDHGRRPFDEILKRSIREPGVCRDLLNQVIPVEWCDLVPERISWLDGQLQPRQRTWNTDLIGELQDGSIVHIEQETSNHDEMHLRMMEYGSLIAVHHGLGKQVRQIYLCTGDYRPFEYEQGRFIINDRASIRNSFQFIYAGDFNAWGLLESPLFTVASLGLLSESIEDLPKFVDALIERAYREFSGSGLTNQLVSCVMMASLRRRAQMFVEALPMFAEDPIFQDPYFQEIFDTRERGRAIALLDRTIAKSSIIIPNDFIIWLSRHPNIDLIEDVAASLKRAAAFENILLENGINWNDVKNKIEEEKEHYVTPSHNRLRS
jgi:hypothetical protein